jgi:hypothetical protein
MYRQATDADGYVTLWSINRETGEKITRWAPASFADILGETAEMLSETGCVWFGVATRRQRLKRGRRGGDDDCQMIPALWLDIDINHPVHNNQNLPTSHNEALNIIDRFPVEPTAIIDSGHGLQAWWILDRLQPADQMRPVLDAWKYTWDQHADGIHIDNVFDLARIMRLPGTTNRKADPVPVELLTYTGELHQLETITKHLITPPPAPPAPTRQPRQNPGNAPGDHYNRAHTGHQLLEQLGFHTPRTDHTGTHYTRPGKNAKAGTSATVYATDGHTTIWSDTYTASHPALETRRPYDPFGLYTCTQHAGDYKAAAAALQAQGYGPAPGIQWEDITPTAPTQTHRNNLPPVLPPDLWDAREMLHLIRQAARSHIVAPDAVLAAALTRIAAQDHRIKICTYGTRLLGTSYYTALIGNPGTGKSTAMSAARQAINNDPNRIPEIGTGSGEGLTETLFGYETDDDGKQHKIRTRYGFISTIDEGAKLFELASRGGFTFPSMMRSAWTDEGFGDQNATEERRRNVAPHSYALGITIGFQPDRLQPIFDDIDIGTPQRFLWMATTDPHAPTVTPDWPHNLNWNRSPRTPDSHHEHMAIITLPLPPEAQAEFVTTQQARTRGDIVVNPMEVHALVLQAKTAALLTLLDSRNSITTEDWQLAAVICATSTEVRDWAQARLEQKQARIREAAHKAAARTAAASEDSARERALELAVAAVARKIAADGQTKRGDLSRAVSGRHKAIVPMDEIIQTAITRGLMKALGENQFGPPD